MGGFYDALGVQPDATGGLTTDVDVEDIDTTPLETLAGLAAVLGLAYLLVGGGSA